MSKTRTRPNIPRIPADVQSGPPPSVPSVPPPADAIPETKGSITETGDSMTETLGPITPKKNTNAETAREIAEQITPGLATNVPCCVLPISPGHMPLCFEVPYAEPHEGYAAKKVQVDLKPREAVALARLTAALESGEATLPDGRKVTSHNLAVRWLINQVADAFAP